MITKKTKKRRPLSTIAEHVEFLSAPLRDEERRERISDGCSRMLPTTCDGTDWRRLLIEDRWEL